MPEGSGAGGGENGRSFDGPWTGRFIMSEKICVLHITQCAGGVLRYIQMLLKYLDKDKFENIIICSFDSKREDYGENIAAFEQVDMRREISFNDLKATRIVRKLIKKYKPDIVYAHSSKAGAIARLANIGFHNKCIYNPHGWAFNMRCSNKQKKIYKTIERLAAHFCDKIICISEFEQYSAIQNAICPKEKISLILNGIDIQDCENSSSEQITREFLNIPKDAFVIGMVGRMCPQKAPDVFIKVARKIKESIPDSFFMIVGNGEMEQEIKQYADKYGFLNSLIITGWVDHVLNYVKLFDIAVLFSRWEGFGLVLPEYMLAQKPIVASSVDAIPSIIKDGETGLLVKPDDIDNTYKIIIKLYNDYRLRERLSENAFKDVYARV